MSSINDKLISIRRGLQKPIEKIDSNVFGYDRNDIAARSRSDVIYSGILAELENNTYNMYSQLRLMIRKYKYEYE